MEVKEIFFYRVLTAQEISKKWGITEHRLFQIADNQDFPFFIFIKKYHNPSTKEEFLLCKGPFYTYLRNSSHHIIHSEAENIVFNPQDIELFERAHPEILRKADETQKNLESENNQLKARLEVLETELAACREQLEDARRDISGKEDAELPYTLWREVLAMRKEGMTDKQIAAKLNDKGQGASRSQLGALLYTGKEKLPAAKTLQDNGTELFR